MQAQGRCPRAEGPGKASPGKGSPRGGRGHRRADPMMGSEAPRRRWLRGPGELEGTGEGGSEGGGQGRWPGPRAEPADSVAHPKGTPHPSLVLVGSCGTQLGGSASSVFCNPKTHRVLPPRSESLPSEGIFQLLEQSLHLDGRALSGVGGGQPRGMPQAWGWCRVRGHCECKSCMSSMQGRFPPGGDLRPPPLCSGSGVFISCLCLHRR